MKILLIGSEGQLGQYLHHSLSPLGKVIPTTHSTLDLQDKDHLASFIKNVKPDVVVNAAAYTNVDAAETDQKTAMEVNAEAPGVIASVCKDLDSILIHYSTDYVFDGNSKTPYTENDPTHPINVYGASKLEGEKAIVDVGGKHLIFRTAWLFSNRGNSFFQTMLHLAKQNEVINVVNDQIGSPTTASAVAEITAHIIKKNEYDWGIYHLAGTGETSRYDFAKEIFSYIPGPKLEPVPSNSFPTPAKRPAYSALSSEKLERTYSIQIPTWQEMLRQLYR